MAGGVSTRPAGTRFAPGVIRVKLVRPMEGGAEVLKTLGHGRVRLEYVRYQFGTWHVVRAVGAGGEPLVGRALDEALQQLRALKQVRHADKDPILQPLAVPSDPYFGSFQQWHHALARLPGAWDITTGSNSVVVAVLDDGITQHPDFGSRLLPGYDFVSDMASAADNSGRDADPTRPAVFENGQVNFHGTHVAGTIGASTNNGIGAAGVDWNARILPVRVLGIGGGSLSDIVDGLRWAGGLSVPGVPSNPSPAKILNLSLGGLGPPDLQFQDVVDQLDQQKRIVVVAAGNSDLDASQFQPANQARVITVGAVGMDGKRASYSNFGSAVDVMAPGGDFEDLDQNGVEDNVFSLYATATGTPAYEGANGTSMAAPHVAGILALMAAVNPLLDHALAESILRTSASAQFRCTEGCGAGLVNAELAVQMANGAASYVGPRIMVSPGALELGAATTATVEVHNIGAQSLHFTLYTRGNYAPRAGLADGTTGTVAPSQKQALNLNIDRSGLANGTYQLTLRFVSNGGTEEVPVSFRVGPRPEPALKVLAVRKESSGELVTETSAPVSSGSAWNWSLSVRPGTYYLVAGSDEDNDGVVGEPGEHFGAWPLETDPQPITLYAQQVLTGLDFSTSAQLVVPTPGTALFGAPCQSNSDCASLACLIGAGNTGTCTQPCAQGTACPAGHFCGYAYMTNTGAGVNVCQAKLANGYLCEAPEECVSGTCFQGYSENTCEKPCQSPTDCAATETCTGDYNAQGALIALCRAPLALGSPCASDDACDRPAALGGTAVCAADVPWGMCLKSCSAGCPTNSTCASFDYDGDSTPESVACLASCAANTDCRKGFTCVLQASGARACVPQRGQVCTTSLDCWSDEFCDKAAGFCRSAYGTSFTVTELSAIFSATADDGPGDPPDAFASVNNSLVNVSTAVVSNSSIPTWSTAFTVAVPRGGTLEVNFTDVDALGNEPIGKYAVPDWPNVVRVGSLYDAPSSGKITSVYFKIAPVP